MRSIIGSGGRRTGSPGPRGVGPFGPVPLGFGSRRLSSPQPGGVLAPEARRVAAPAPGGPGGPAGAEHHETSGTRTNRARWALTPTWSGRSQRPAGGAGEESRRPSGKASCPPAPAPLWPSAAPVGPEVGQNQNLEQGAAEGEEQTSDLQPHLLQELLSSLHPLGDEALQLPHRLRPRRRLLRGTTTQSRAQLRADHGGSARQKVLKLRKRGPPPPVPDLGPPAGALPGGQDLVHGGAAAASVRGEPLSRLRGPRLSLEDLEDHKVGPEPGLLWENQGESFSTWTWCFLTLPASRWDVLPQERSLPRGRLPVFTLGSVEVTRSLDASVSARWRDLMTSACRSWSWSWSQEPSASWS